MRTLSGQTKAKKRAQYDTSSTKDPREPAGARSREGAAADQTAAPSCVMGLGEVVGAYLRHGAALDALDDHLATPVTAVGDRDASPRAELFQD